MEDSGEQWSGCSGVEDVWVLDDEIGSCLAKKMRLDRAVL